MREGFNRGCMYCKIRIEQVCKADAIRLRSQFHLFTVRVEAPWQVVVHYFNMRFIFSVQELCSRNVLAIFIGNVNHIRSVPLNSNDGYRLIPGYSFYGTSNRYVLKPCHTVSPLMFYLSICLSNIFYIYRFLYEHQQVFQH